MAFLIYLVGVFAPLQVALFITVLGCFIVAALFKIEANDRDKPTPLLCKKLLKSGFVLMTLLVFTPSSKTVATMILLPKLINNEKIVGISEKSLDLLNVKLDEWLKQVTK